MDFGAYENVAPTDALSSDRYEPAHRNRLVHRKTGVGCHLPCTLGSSSDPVRYYTQSILSSVRELTHHYTADQFAERTRGINALTLHRPMRAILS